MRFEKGPGAWETLNAEAMKGTEERTEATLNVLLRRGEALRERIALCESQSGVLSLCLSLFFFFSCVLPKKGKIVVSWNIQSRARRFAAKEDAGVSVPLFFGVSF